MKQAPRPNHRRAPTVVVITALFVLALVAIAVSAFALTTNSKSGSWTDERPETSVSESQVG